MSDITDAYLRLDNALSAWREDPNPANAPRQLDAALAAAGDLQRALLLERLDTDRRIAPATKGTK